VHADLCCAAHPAQPAGCTAEAFWLQGKLVTTEEPAGSFYLVLATAPPA